MNNLTKYGDLMIDGEFIVCAHPGLCCRRHNYAIEGQGLFDVLVHEKENTLNKPKSLSENPRAFKCDVSACKV